MSEDMRSTTELTKKGWPGIGLGITRVSEEEPEIDRGEPIEFTDTDASSLVRIYSNQRLAAKERTELRAETEEETAEVNHLGVIEKTESQERVEDINEMRIALLSRKYASSLLAPEESARLNIVNEKLQRLIPSISERELATMEDISFRLDKANALVREMDQKYGLDED
jgi:hypothetical protein